MLLIISCLVVFPSNVFYRCSSEHCPHHCCTYNISEVLVSTGNLNLELQMLKRRGEGERTSYYKISILQGQGVGRRGCKKKKKKPKSLKKAGLYFWH